MDALKEKNRLDSLLPLSALLLGLAYLLSLAQNFTVPALLWLVAAAALCWKLFRHEWDEKLFYLFAAIAALALVALLWGKGEGQYFAASSVFAGAVGQSLVFLLPALLVLAGFVGLCVLAAVYCGGKLPELSDRVLALWYLPALLFAVGYMAAWLWGILSAIFGKGLLIPVVRGTSLRVLLWALFALLAGMKAAGKESLILHGAAEPTRSAPDGKGAYTSVALLLFLCFITLGIWGLVWIWRTTAALNERADRPRKPLYEMLFCLLLPFYFIYWAYKSAQLVDGEDGRFSTLCLVLSVLLPPVAMMLLQDKLNTMAVAPSAPPAEDWPFYTVEGEPVEACGRQAAAPDAVEESEIEVEILEEAAAEPEIEVEIVEEEPGAPAAEETDVPAESAPEEEPKKKKASRKPSARKKKAEETPEAEE